MMMGIKYIFITSTTSGGERKDVFYAEAGESRTLQSMHHSGEIPMQGEALLPPVVAGQ